jgi:hypothetical protein
LSQAQQAELETLRAENKRMKEAYTAAGASFAALNMHNKQQTKANLRLMSTHAALIKSQEDKMKKYQALLRTLKDEKAAQRQTLQAARDREVMAIQTVRWFTRTYIYIYIYISNTMGWTTDNILCNP